MQARKKILVVDDAATFLEWAELLLTKAGYDVTATDNPVLVPSLIFRGDFDLLLLDVSMPLLDGDEVARIMGDSSAGPTIVFSSAKPEEELRKLVASTSAAGFIRKTMNPSVFLALVAGFLGRNGHHQSSAAGT